MRNHIKMRSEICRVPFQPPPSASRPPFLQGQPPLAMAWNLPYLVYP